MAEKKLRTLYLRLDPELFNLVQTELAKANLQRAAAGGRAMSQNEYGTWLVAQTLGVGGQYLPGMTVDVRKPNEVPPLKSAE